MTRSRKRKLQRTAAKWAGMPLASAALAYGGVAYAQQAETGGAALEEVIVTAQKRVEDVQKVPISIQVLGGEKLEQLQASEFLDFAKFMPSVTFKTLGPGRSEIYFRGISTGSEGLHAGYLPSSGLYLDETPVTTVSGSLDPHVYDIERVEGLAGPQGTLYGASSLAGTMRIITNKPDHTRTYGGFDVTGTKFGKGDSGGSVEGFINIPVSEKVAVRLVGYYQHDGGFMSNVPGQVTFFRPDTVVGGGVWPPNPPVTCATPGTHCLTVDNSAIAKNNINDVDSYGGRAALKIDLNDQWSILPVIIYQDQKANGSFGYSPKVGDLKYRDLRATYNKDRWYQSALTVTGKISDLDFVYSGGYMDRKVDNQVDYSNYSQAYEYYGYCCYTYLTGDPANPTPPIDPTQYNRNKDKYTKVSHEVRLSSPADWRLRFTVGAFLQRQTDNIRAEFRVDNLQPWYEVDGAPDTLYLSQQDRTDRDRALFGELTYDLTDKVKLTGGIRAFQVDNTLFGFFGFNNNGNHGTGEALCNKDSNGDVIPDRSGTDRPCINTRKRLTESGSTNKINLVYQIDPDRMIYGTYSTGFRPGGNNRKPIVQSWKADTLTNYEVGWKMNLLNRRLRFNGAVFLEKWKNAQASVQGLNGITSIVNADTAESKGFETDVTWLVVDNLTLSLSGTYADAKTTEDWCGPTREGIVTPGQVNCNITGLSAKSGSQLPSVPKVKGNATARYHFNVGDFDSFIQAVALYQGSTTYSLQAIANSFVGDTPSFTSFDLSAGTGKKNWTLEAYIQNLTDERGELSRVSECADPNGYCWSNFKVIPIKPMNFGIKYGMKF
jgi:outer membrane receptor protein involved in Fe transport